MKHREPTKAPVVTPDTLPIKKQESPEMTPETFKDEEYLKRRELIPQSDYDIIYEVEHGEKGSDFTSEAAQLQYANFHRGGSTILRPFIEGKRLIDIGGGKYGFGYASNVYTGRVFGEQVDEGIRFSEYVNVDPFYTDKEMDSFREEKIELRRGAPGTPDQEMSDKDWQALEKSLVHEKENGLRYLLSQETGSGNVSCSAIDYSLISSDPYLKRLAQEAYRVVPEDGVLVVTSSRAIEREARELFPYERKINVSTFFSKQKLPPERAWKESNTKRYERYLPFLEKGIFFRDVIFEEEKEEDLFLGESPRTFEEQVKENMEADSVNASYSGFEIGEFTQEQIDDNTVRISAPISIRDE